MAPLVESTPDAGGADILPDGGNATQQTKTNTLGSYREYHPTQTRYTQYMYSRRPLNRPKQQAPKLVPKTHKTSPRLPDKRFRKLERCYLMPMGPEYKVPTRQIQFYKPSPHQPTFRQRQLRAPRDHQLRTYQWREYRLTKHNYDYAFGYAHNVREDARNEQNFVPAGGVAVLPPILGNPAPRTDEGNGMYRVRDYRYTPRTFRFDHYPRYREYKRSSPLPYREYDHYFVYLGGRPAGQRIQRRQLERGSVKREAPPLQKPQPAPVPVIVPVVAPAPAAAAKPPPARKEDPPPEEPEQPPAEEEPPEEPEEPTPREPTPPAAAAPPVVVAAAAVPPAETPPTPKKTPTPAPRRKTPTPTPSSSPVPPGVVAGAALGGAAVVGGAAAAAAVATKAKTPTPAPRKTPPPSPKPAAEPSAQDNSPAVPPPVAAAAVPVTAAAAVAAVPPQQAPPSPPTPAPVPEPEPQPVKPEPQAPVVAAAAAPAPVVPVAAAAQAPEAAAAPPPAAKPPPPNPAADPAVPAQASDDNKLSGTLGSVQRSLDMFS